jgi:hypothetical protein
MFSTVAIGQTATTYDLTTVDDANAYLGLTSSTDNDALVAAQITAASQILATQCNRVFAMQDLVETFRVSWRDCDSRTLQLKRIPIVAVVSIEQNDQTIDASNYDVDLDAGIIWRHGQFGFWRAHGKIVVTYTAGFDLPDDVPPPLEQACLELMKEQRFAQLRGDPTIRSISHDNISVFYQQTPAGVTAGLAELPPSVATLIAPYRLPPNA